MTGLAPSVENVLEKLVEIARGDSMLVQQAFAKAGTQAGRPPTLEEIVAYIEKYRTKEPGES